MRPQPCSLDELVIMSIFFHGASLDAVDGKRGGTANTPHILKQVRVWRADWDSESKKTYLKSDDTYNQHLVELSLDRSYIKSWPRDPGETYPQFTGYGLTREGREYAEKLLTQFPHITKTALSKV